MIHGGITQAQWEEIYKFPGNQGTIKKILFLQGHEGFAVGFPNILYRTGDYGNIWDTIQVGNKSITGLQFVNDSLAYAVTAFKDPDFLYKTIDRGKTWYPVITNLNIPIIYSMYFINDTLGFVGSSYDVYKTMDGGKTWTQKQVPSGSSVDALVFPTSDRGFGTGCNACFFMETNDQGKTWQSHPYKGYTSFEFVDSLYGFAAGSNFLQTTDGGDTWATIFTAPPQANLQLSCPVRDTCYSVGGSGIFKTTDGWKTWSKQGNVSPWGFTQIDCVNIDTCYALSHTNRLFRTFNGGEGGLITAIDEGAEIHFNNKEIIVFPNPTSDQLFLDGPDFKVEYEYSIEDVTGRNWMTGKWRLTTGLDVTSLDTGFYFLRIVDSNGAQRTLGFVKM